VPPSSLVAHWEQRTSQPVWDEYGVMKLVLFRAYLLHIIEHPSPVPADTGFVVLEERRSHIVLRAESPSPGSGFD
jgi:hypothetical protein